MLTGKDSNKARSDIRKALKQGLVLAKRVYYDYYDSCHPPVETPDAPFESSLVVFGENPEKYFKKGSYACLSLELVEPNTYRGFTSHSTYIIKIIVK